MPSGRKPRGDEPIVVTVATKVTESEREMLIDRYGSMYAALREGIRRLTEDEEK